MKVIFKKRTQWVLLVLLLLIFNSFPPALRASGWQSTDTATTLTFSDSIPERQETKPAIAPGISPVYSRPPSSVNAIQTDRIYYHVPPLGREPSTPQEPPARVSKHYDDYQKQVLDSVKQSKLLKILSDTSQLINPQENSAGQSLAPEVGRSFEGNGISGAYPPDNAMAISDDGWIVSIVNSSISFITEDGDAVLDTERLDDFFDYLNTPNAFYYDPRILYDPTEDKFVLVCLHGNTPATSILVVSFSVSSNPTDGWYTYVYDGNLGNANAWFDYPMIGVSTNNLYITGNLFDSNNNFQEVVLMQFDKAEGFAGSSMSSVYWSDIVDGNNQTAFGIKPVSYGYDGGYGPGIYLISSASSFGSTIQLYDVTQDLGNDPVLQAYNISCPFYSSGVNAAQLGSSKTLNVNDCRIQGAFYASGRIHYMHHDEFDNTGYNGLLYGVLNVSEQSVETRNFGLNGYSYAFPNMAPIDGASSSDPDVAVGFLRSSTQSYPEFRVVTIEEGLDFSGSVSVKSGLTPITSQTSSLQRWGDYSGVSRRHGGEEPSVWIFGCFGKENTYGNWIAEIVPEGSVAPPTLSVSPTSLSLNASGSSATINVSSNCSSWTVSESASWFSVSPTSGSGDDDFSVNYQTNSSTQSRTATITISGCGITRTVSVTQAGANATLTVSPTSLSLNASGSSANINVSSNCSSWTVSESASWFSVSPSSGSGDDDFSINYQTNSSTQSRTATITISGCGITRTVSVTQAGANASLTVNPTSLSLNASGSSATINVSSNCSSWTVSESASWFSVNPSSGSGDDDFSVNYQTNSSTQSRTATITISGCGITRTVSVTQAGANASLTVNPTSLSLNASGSSATINVSSNCSSWTVSESASWFSVNPSSGSGDDDFSVNYQTNSSTQSRTATITISGCGITRTVSVTQAGANASLTVNPTSLSLNASGSSANISVSSNCSSWTVSESASWFSVSPGSGSGDDDFSVNYQTNSSTQSRTATITISGCGITRTVSVTQAGANASLTVNPTSLSLNASGSSANISVSSNCSSWTVSESASWFSVSPSSGSGDDDFSVNYQTNSSTQSRTATITISGCGITRTVSVTQAGMPVDYPWTPIPSSINHTVIIPSTLIGSVDGLPLSNGDLIGFFFQRDGELVCSNFAVWEGENTSCAVYGNEAEAGMPKNGFDIAEVFQIRVYRIDSEQEFAAQATYAPIGTAGIVSHTNSYATDGISMLTDLEASSSLSLSIPLVTGWNMISSYVLPDSPDILELLNPVSDDIALLKDQDGLTVIPSFGINNVGDWNIIKGYQVKANTNIILTIEGQQVDPQNTPIPITPGWQIISYLRDQASSAIGQLAGIIDEVEIVKNNAGEAYIPAFGINNIGDFIPTQGYKLKATAATTLVFPGNFMPEPTAGRKTRSEKTITSLQHFLLDPNLNTGNNSTLIFPASSVMSLMAVDDEIGVFTPAGVLCGAAVYNGDNFAITVWGDDPTSTEIVEGMQTGEAYQYLIWKAADDIELALNIGYVQNNGMYQEDDVVVIAQIELVNRTTYSVVAERQLRVYPNPAKSSFFVDLPEGIEFLKLYDAKGQLLQTYTQLTKGQREFLSDQLPRGLLWISAIDEEGRIWQASVSLQ